MLRAANETAVFSRMKKILPILLVPVVTVGMVVALALISKPGASSGGTVSTGNSGLAIVGDAQYNFSTISMAKGTVRTEFQVKNTTAQTVTLTKLFTSCMCTKASLTIDGKTVGPFGMPGHIAVPSISETLEPGATATVMAEFDPAAHGPAGVGAIDRKVTLENDAGSPLEFGFTAFVEP